MSFYLATFDKNWADEFDVAGFAILRPHEMRYLQAKLNEYNDLKTDIYFGTNQGWDEVTYGELKESIKFNRISKENYNQFKRMGLMTLGFNVFENLLESFYKMDQVEDEKPDPLEALKNATS